MWALPSVRLPDVIACDQISQAFPLCICIHLNILLLNRLFASLINGIPPVFTSALNQMAIANQEIFQHQSQ